LDAAAGGATAVAFGADGAPRWSRRAGLDGALAQLLAIIDRAACDGTWQRLKSAPSTPVATPSTTFAQPQRQLVHDGDLRNRAKARSYRERRRSAPA